MKHAKKPLLAADVTPDPGSSNLKKLAKLPLRSAEGCHTRRNGQHWPLRRIMGHIADKTVIKPSESVSSKKEFFFSSHCLFFRKIFPSFSHSLFCPSIVLKEKQSPAFL
jgi:hypothetical protein